MFAQFENMAEKLQKLEGMLSDPSVIGNQEQYRKVAKEHQRTCRAFRVLHPR